MKEKAYHEKVNNRNEVHLRELVRSYRFFVSNFLLELNQQLLPEPELPMHTI